MRRLYIWHAILLALFYSPVSIAGTSSDSSRAARSYIAEPSTPAKAPEGICQLEHARAKCIDDPDDIRLIGVSPYTNRNSFEYLAPAIKSLNLRLSEIIKACESEGIPACHVFQGAYGSGFLKENVMGNDLDYLIAVDLGKITIHGTDTDTAAHEIIRRIDSYLRILHLVVDSRQDPDLSVMNWGSLGREGLENQDGLEEKLVGLLDDTVKGNGHLVLLKGNYTGLVPNALPFGDGYLYENTIIKFISRKIRYNDWMFPGLREFSIMLHFVFNLELEGPCGKKASIGNMVFDPTFMPTGQVLNLMDSFLWTVPAGSASASFFRKELFENSKQLVESRPLRSFGILFHCERLFFKRDIMKALKRLHQGFDWIYPVFDNSFRAEISAFLNKHLRNPDALLCQDIAEMAQMLNVVLKNPDLSAMYDRSGDIKSTLSQMSSDLMKLENRYPQLLENGNSQLRSSLDELHNIFESNTYPALKERTSELLNQTESSARGYLIGFMPDSGKILEFKDRILGRLYKAGFKVLPVYGMSDGSLGVLKKDLNRITTLDMLNSTPGKIGAPAFKYRLINESEYPMDNVKGRPYPCSRLILRPGQSEKEEENYRKIMDALGKDMGFFIYSQNQLES